MNKTLTKLSITTLALFVFSIFVYKFDNYRGIDLITGSEFISSLDIDNISSFTIKGKDTKELTFTRDNDFFKLNSFGGYPTSGKKISDLIYKLTGITVREKVSENSKDYPRFGVDEKSSEAYFSFKDLTGKEVLSFYIGKSKDMLGTHRLAAGA